MPSQASISRPCKDENLESEIDEGFGDEIFNVPMEEDHEMLDTFAPPPNPESDSEEEVHVHTYIHT